MWYPVHALNLTLLQAKGRSNLILRLEFIKKIVGMISLIVTIPFGIIAMCIGLIICSIICLYINAYYTKKYFNISFFQQMKDTFPSLFLSVSMGVIVYLLTKLKISDIFTLILGISAGCLFYLGIAIVFKMKEWKDLWIILSLHLTKKTA